MAVNPRGSSQECSGCGREVPKKLDERWHHCPHCGFNSARVIKYRAVGRPVLFAPAARSAKAREMSDAVAGVTVCEAGRSP
ncbi:transposase [Synechococcus sp. OH30]